MLPFGYEEAAAFLDRCADASVRASPSSLAGAVAGLSRLGLAEGTPVVLALPNGRRLLEQWFAALLTGAVPLAASPSTPSARVARLVERVGAGAIVRPRATGVDVVPSPATARPTTPGTVLMLTSGTSGVNSACLHRVASLLRNARLHADVIGLRRDDTVLVSLPLFFSYAIVAQALAAFVTGARVVVSGPPFSPAGYRSSLEAHGVTASSVTPTMARALLARERPLAPGLRVLTVGGDTIAPRHVGDLLGLDPRLELYVTYGLTEAGPRVATLAAHREPASRHGSVGRPLPGVGVALRDAPAPGGPRELLVSTGTAMIGRAGEPPARRTLLAGGVVATGDLFRIDDDGYLFFRGRLSDFAVVRGEKVSLAGVRQFVQSLPGVVRCATQVRQEAGDAARLDLDVQVDADPAGAEADVRRAVAAFLLPAERPDRIAVRRADLAEFQK